MSKNVNLNNVTTYTHGRLQLIVGLCEKIGLAKVFNDRLNSDQGRPRDIPSGIEAEIMIAGICVEEGYRPLYAIKDYYRNKDLEGIFHYPIELDQLNDDRFGTFLDRFYEAGCRQIFLEISAKAFFEYGIKIKNINYDTTSKVMWGEYEQTDPSLDSGKVGQISIDFGHSKEKRGDKRQIKIGLGTTNGVVTDAKVLSGNMDDKTYNKNNLEDVDRLLYAMQVDRDKFYYIADSSLFTEDNIIKANGHYIKFITRMPKNLKVAKSLLATPLPEDAQAVTFKNARNEEVKYWLTEDEVKYKGHECKVAVIYSQALEETKKKACLKKVDKERKQIESKIKKYRKRRFKCEPDAEKEIDLLLSKHFVNLKYHNVEIEITKIIKRRPGKPSKNPERDKKIIEYQLDIEVAPDEDRIQDYIRQQCTFILSSNDLEISGEKMLREYKTQSDVERRFKVLKSPKYMNSLFLKTPKRVEALVYLLLICLMMLTIAERVVRGKLKENNEVLYGTEMRELKRPTFYKILEIMDRIMTVTYIHSGRRVREIRTIDESCRKIIEYLRLPESCFAWNDGG